MSPVIRVDNQVLAWLKSHADPFEDSPNSVLRRLSGIDPTQSAHKPWRITSPSLPPRPPRDMPVAAVPGTRPRVRITGDFLNRHHRLGARHALYHRDGTLYDRLTSFPAILCDPTGYVRYERAYEFQRDPHVSIGEKVNVPRGLPAHPRYTRFPSPLP